MPTKFLHLHTKSYQSFLLSTETEFLLVPPSLIAVACIAAAARGLRVRMSVNDLCLLTRTPAAAAELVARHVERVLARETQPQEPRPRHTHPSKQTATDQTHLPNTPTDVQDVHFWSASVNLFFKDCQSITHAVIQFLQSQWCALN